jgi:hypothetical protein
MCLSGGIARKADVQQHGSPVWNCLSYLVVYIDLVSYYYCGDAMGMLLQLCIPSAGRWHSNSQCSGASVASSMMNGHQQCLLSSPFKILVCDLPRDIKYHDACVCSVVV